MTDSRILCPAELNQETGRQLLAAVRECSIPEGQEAVLDFSETKAMDSRGGAWLVEIAHLLRARGAQFRFERQHGDVAEFIDLIEPGLLAVTKERVEETGGVAALGQQAIDFWAELKEMVNLVIDAIYWTVIGPFEGKRVRWKLVIDEIHEMGVRGLQINSLMNFLLGLIIAMLSAAQLKQVGGVIFVADLVVIAFARELAAVMTTVVVSARTGAAITAELATMKVQEEIDALRGMGLNVSQFLVAPKLLALLIVMPCLVAFGMVMGIAGGAVWGIGVMGIDANAWWRESLHAANLHDVVQGMLKSLVFAVMIVLVGCHNGLRVSGGARGVGLMTTRAVVMDIFFLIVIDMIFAVFFYYF